MTEKQKTKQDQTSISSLAEIIKEKDYKRLSKHLKDGISDYLESDTFKNYLNFVSSFHKYSQKNNRLLLAQNPKVKHVASFKKWQTLGRNVQKGSKALYVYAPFIKDKVDQEGKKVVDKNGEIVTETHYFLTPVFDVSQTEGEPLPQLVYHLEEDLIDHQQFTRTYNALVKISPVKVTIDSIRNGANGYYNPETKEIVLQKHLGEAMTIKVLLHEIAHAKLHANSQAKFGDCVYSRQEFEAESVAYVVANHLGIDTSDYSFGYLASWTEQGNKIEELTQSLDTITVEARTLIEKADELLSMNQRLEVPKNKFEERIALARKKEMDAKRTNKSNQEKTNQQPLSQNQSLNQRFN